MQINWFTVIAQVLNFLLLVWLLKRFLYKPILKAIDEREEKIALQIKDAAAKETIAIMEQAEFSKKNETFDKQKKGLMDKAVAETNEERQKLLEAARNDAAELRSKLEKALNEMQENLNRDLAQKTQQEVFAIARKTLTDLASVSLEEQSANFFIKRINELKKEEKKQFIAAFKSGSNPVLVKSAFDLPEKQQTEISSAVNEILGSETHFQFKTTPEIISGIELTSNGYKLAWSISEYLNSLQKSISQTSNEEPKAEPKVEAKEKRKPVPKVEAKPKPKAKLKAKPNKK
jgi:F-type H+-transporting ATPase subunit b